MQTAILITNIGVRDLGQKDTQLFNTSGEHVFEEIRKICENLDPFIEKIKESFNLEKILLFVTKQITPYPKDSICTASIVKKILSSRYGIDEQCISINEVSQNPSDYIEMLITYHSEIKKIPSDINQVFVSTTGGTPHSLFESIFKFNEKVMLLYKSQDTEEIIEYKIQNQLSSAKIEIDNENYKKALNLLEDTKKSDKCVDLQKIHYDIMNLKLKLCENQFEENPENSFLKAQISVTLEDFGIFLINVKLIEKAKKIYEREIQILQDLLNKYPENEEYLSLIGSAYYNLGYVLSELGLIEEAKQRYEESLQIHENLLEIHPENEEYQALTGSAYYNLGNLLSELGSIDEATNRYERALKVHIQFIERYPEIKQYHSSVLKNEFKLIESYFYCAENEINNQTKMMFFGEVIHMCEQYQDLFIKSDSEDERKKMLEFKIRSQIKFSFLDIEMQKKHELSAEKCDEAIKKIKKIKDEIKDVELEKLSSSAIYCFQIKKLIFQGKKFIIHKKDLQNKHYRSFVLKDVLNVIQLYLDYTEIGRAHV